MPKLTDQNLARSLMSNAMEAINNRLKQLEDIETSLPRARGNHAKKCQGRQAIAAQETGRTSRFS